MCWMIRFGLVGIISLSMVCYLMNAKTFGLGVLLVSLSLTKDLLHAIKNQSRRLKRKREEIRQIEEILRRINENIEDFEPNADAV